jgi:hypothetical protein
MGFVLGRYKTRVPQNRGEARLSSALKTLFAPPDYHLLTGNAEFMTNIPEGVFTLAGFLAYVESSTAEIMSVNRVQFCVGRLETTRLSITKATDVEHIQALRRRYGNNQ